MPEWKEKDMAREALAKLLQIEKLFADLRKSTAKLGSADALWAMTAWRNKAPASLDLSKLYGEGLEALDTFLQHATRMRSEANGRIIVDFIKGLKEEGVPLRTIDASNHRVGPLKLRIDATTGSVKCLYNEEPVLPAARFASAVELRNAYDRALKELVDSEVAEELLKAAFIEALHDAVDAISNAGGKQSHHRSVAPRVRILEWASFVRLSLIRNSIRRAPWSALDARLQGRFTRYAFLYNIDRYNQYMASTSGRDARVVFITGAQSEMKNQVTLNGLDPNANYEHKVWVELARKD